MVQKLKNTENYLVQVKCFIGYHVKMHTDKQADICKAFTYPLMRPVKRKKKKKKEITETR